MILWMVFLGLVSRVRAGVLITSFLKQDEIFLGMRSQLRDELADTCLASKDSKYSYNPEDAEGPNHWVELSKCCGGTRQSPVDIRLAETQTACFQQIQISNPGTTTAKMINNGHTLKVKSFSKTMGVQNVPFAGNDHFELLQIHLHWGRVDSKASEHLVDGAGYSGEMHLVFFNSKYKTADEAMRYSDGLTVLGVFFKEGQITWNKELRTLLWKAYSCRNPGASVDVRVNPLLLIPFTREYVTYAGSLTTPPCLENVRWIVFLETLDVSSFEMMELRSLMDKGGEPIAEHSNERPVQPVNGRPLHFNRC